jgi:Fe-S-cluster-containing hydrogenase component 2
VILIDEARCSGCGVCLTACPQDAIVLEAERAEIREELCNSCGACLSACPEGAIMDVEQALPAQPVPAAAEAETTALVRSASVQPAPTRARPVKVIWGSPTAIERRVAVAGTAMTVGPVALNIFGRLVERWLRRGAVPQRGAGQRDYAVSGPRGGRRRRRRGGRC